MEAESKLDLVTTIIASVCVAAYAAIAIRHVARDDLGFSLEEIRYAAMTMAAVTAVFIAIDRLGKTSGNPE